MSQPPPSLCTPEEAAAISLQQSAWRFESWLHTWPLNRDTVLDYFKHSDFYDRTCNNEVALMQTMGGASVLGAMVGIEYEVDHSLSTDDFFLIRKQYRLDPNTTQLLAMYYVIGIESPNDPLMPPRGTVFPLPDLHTVLRTNLATSLLYLQEAFEELNKHAHFHPAVHGYQWDFDQEQKEAEREGKEGEAAAAAAVQVEATASQPRHPFAGLVEQAIYKISQPLLQQGGQQPQR